MDVRTESALSPDFASLKNQYRTVKTQTQFILQLRQGGQLDLKKIDPVGCFTVRNSFVGGVDVITDAALSPDSASLKNQSRTAKTDTRLNFPTPARRQTGFKEIQPRIGCCCVRLIFEGCGIG